MSAEDNQLSRNYRGWRSNRRGRNQRREPDPSAPSIPSQSKWLRSNQTFSEDEMIKRKTKAILSKLTPEKLPRLLPKLVDVYKGVTNEDKLQAFLSIIFECVMINNFFHQQYIEILTELLAIDTVSENSTANISVSVFKKCVLTLSDKNFKKSIEKLQANQDDLLSFSYVDDYEWHKLAQKRSLLSISKFIGKLAASDIIELATSLKYLKALFMDEKNENNIEAVCKFFSEIWELISYEKRIALMNAEMNVINVNLKSYLLVYGYARGYGNCVPGEIVDLCIGYYDVDCYLFGYYQKLERIMKNSRNYGVRIRMLIQNITQMRDVEQKKMSIMKNH